MNQVCFVLMPFGKKAGPDGRLIDFDAVYSQLIAPAIETSGVTPLRADHEVLGGMIHRQMFERLLLSPYAIADLTLGNANVCYELGVRHASRPNTTLQLFAEGQRLPFDIQDLRTISYRLTEGGVPDSSGIAGFQQTLSKFIAASRNDHPDSPVYELFPGELVPLDLSRMKASTFAAEAERIQRVKKNIREARSKGMQALREAEKDLDALSGCDPGVLFDLLVAYRAVESHSDMVRLVEAMPVSIRSSVIIREQYAFALNRLERSGDAEEELDEIVEKHGPSSETYGLLGRVHKDKFERAFLAAFSGPALADPIKRELAVFMANGHLEQAIEAYLKGLQADSRDPYPGINAAMLMELRDSAHDKRDVVLSVVRFALDRMIEKGRPDYWTWATDLEYSILVRDQSRADKALSRAVTKLSEPWQGQSTARNLRFIRLVRERRNATDPKGGQDSWATQMEFILEQQAANLKLGGAAPV